MTKYKAIMMVGFVMFWSYKANQGKHKKLSKNGRISKRPISAKFSEEELRRVESKAVELGERHNECSIIDVADYFDNVQKKYRMSRKRPGRPYYHDGGSSISKNKVYVIINYLTHNRKTMKCIEGVGRTRTKLVPITISEQLRKRGTVARIELSALGEEVEKLKNKSKLTAEDILKLIMLENDVMKFPIRMEHDLTARKRYEFFEEAHRMSNFLLKEIGEIKNKCRKSVLNSMSKLIKHSSLYCLSTAQSKIPDTDIGLKVKIQKRTIQAGLGS